MDQRAAPRVVVASDAFKGSLTSIEVADAVRLGLLDVLPDARVVVVPVADGGEGTVAAALSSGWSGVPVEVHGPTGEPVTTTLAVAGDRGPLPRVGTSLGPPRHSGGPTVLVEMADACGLGRLPGGLAAPLTASSRGLGEALRAALDLGAEEVVVGVGGSASTDGGAGLLAALGARLLDAAGRDLPDGGTALARLARLDLSGLDPRLAHTRLVLAADVDNPLLGAAGAAAVFAPQKGATASDVAVLEAALTHWADVVAAALPPVPPSTKRSQQVHRPGAGAAGGVGFALLAVLGAERRSGVDVVLDLVDLDSALVGAELVVTGEGTIDAQTLRGKAVAGVARRAAAHGIPVVAVCGRDDLDPDGLAELGVRTVYPLSDVEPDAARSHARAPVLLRGTGARVAEDWLSRRQG